MRLIKKLTQKRGKGKNRFVRAKRSRIQQGGNTSKEQTYYYYFS